MEDRRYMFPTSNGLLSASHRERMGTAIWEFLWCIDRTTKEYTTDEGDVHGVVLGGKPIQAAEIASGLGMDEKQVRRNLQKLSSEGYILLKRTGRGQIIEVCKSKKFNRRTDKNVLSTDQEGTEKSHQTDKNVRSGTDIFVHSNKTLQYDLTENINNQPQQRASESQGGGVPAPGQLEPDRNTSPVAFDIDAFNTARSYYCKRAGIVELSPLDRQELEKLLSDGVSAETICQGIAYMFDHHQPKHQLDKIRSLSYCSGKILDVHVSKQNQGGRTENGHDRPGSGKRNEYLNRLKRLSGAGD